ncbi:glycosyl transferase family 90-domain-containing protein [Mycena pura]|uniref:Glycosyl transferase family 90-domain-containing protein n=1 Tax=Mycena pura TaxID=153505 RepID=A0AAD6VI79_9AGAR|nr:glycosyl transferase family 90-domain-containing protein [Mycena pura]
MHQRRWTGPRCYWFLLSVFAVSVLIVPFLLYPARKTSTQPPPPKLKTELLQLDPASLKAVASAESSLNALLARQSQTLTQAEARYSLTAGRLPPPNFDKWFSFAKEKNCLIDEYVQIYRDFEPFYRLAIDQPLHFQNTIEKGKAMETKGLKPKKQEAVGMMAIAFKDGVLKMPSYRGTTYATDLPRTLTRFAFLLPDLEFLLNGRDEPRVVFNVRDRGAQERAAETKDPHPFHNAPNSTSAFFKIQSGCNITSKANGFVTDESDHISFLLASSSSDFTTDFWPLLSMTKLSPCFSDILFPAQYYYRTSRWSPKFGANNIAWSNKTAQLYWRGSSNGGRIFGDNYHAFPRFRLVALARNHTTLINAKMTSFVNGHCKDECNSSRITTEYDITGPMAPRREMLKYKYLFDVDGNTFSGRFLGLLRSGSLVFKSTVFEEYFNNWILPYEHYVPVKPDLSDLVQKIEWAIAHEEEARRIQETGKLFAERVMTDAQNDCYFAAVLLEWARLQNYANTSAEH